MESNLTKRREPYQFMLYLGLFGSLLVFLMFSLIYEMRTTEADLANFRMPKIFWYSTAAILLSSYTLHQANLAFYQEQFSKYKILTGATLCLGSAFMLMQLWGWLQMQQTNVRLNNNIAGAFLYLISGFHLLHIAGGITILTYSFLKAIRHSTYVDSFVYSVNPPNQLRLRLVTLYWHFVDGLWVYLFLFFLYHHQ